MRTRRVSRFNWRPRQRPVTFTFHKRSHAFWHIQRDSSNVSYHIVSGGIYSSLTESVRSKLYQLFLLRGHARLCSLHLKGDRPSTVRLTRSYLSQLSRPVRAVVSLLNVRRHTLSFGADQSQYVWSATMRHLTLFVKNSWSVITQYGHSAESPCQVWAMF